VTITLPSTISQLLNKPRPLYTDGARVALPERNGVYCFWWKVEANDHRLPADARAYFQGSHLSAEKVKTGEHDVVVSRKERFYKLLDGPLKGTVPPIASQKGYVCLYVGKTGRDKGIKSRIAEHLAIKSKNREAYLKYQRYKNAPITQQAYPENGASLILKRNTMSQLRAGLEYIFRHHEDSSFARQRIEDSIYITYCVDDDHDFRDRFYLEDLAIGLFHPWFNLDSER
jgi:hypothetical protein